MYCYYSPSLFPFLSLPSFIFLSFTFVFTFLFVLVLFLSLLLSIPFLHPYLYLPSFLFFCSSLCSFPFLSPFYSFLFFTLVLSTFLHVLVFFSLLLSSFPSHLSLSTFLLVLLLFSSLLISLPFLRIPACLGPFCRSLRCLTDGPTQQAASLTPKHSSCCLLFSVFKLSCFSSSFAFHSPLTSVYSPLFYLISIPLLFLFLNLLFT